MRIVSFRNVPDDFQLRRQWNELGLQTGSPEVFYTYEWATAVAYAYGNSLGPWLFVAYENERNEEKLVGAVALATGLENKTVCFLSWTTADYCDFLSLPNRRMEFVSAVVSELKKADVKKIVLASVPDDSNTVGALASIAANYGYHSSARPAGLCAKVSLGRGSERQDVKTGLVGKKMFRRNLNALEKEGAVALRHYRSPGEIDAMLPGFFVSHVARFLVTGRISNIVRGERRAFLAKLAALLSDSGWLDLSVLSVGERPLAWNYGFRFQGSWFWYQPTFDSRFEQCSPGYCLLTKLVAEACDSEDAHIVDLGLGAEGYKERFANAARQTVDVTLLSSRLQHLKAAARYWSVRAIKAYAPVESFIRRALAKFTSVRARFSDLGGTRFFLWACRRFADMFFGRQEVFFYEWTGSSVSGTCPIASQDFRLVPLDFETLGTAAILYEADADTLGYLLQAAQRLRTGCSEGYGLVDPQGKVVHFGWMKQFEGFYIDELKLHLEASKSDDAMIFDCWTPASCRGRGHYGTAAVLIAEKAVREGRRPWIFSASTNTSSVRGLTKTGFERRYSMVRQKILLSSRRAKVVAQSAPDREAIIA